MKNPELSPRDREFLSALADGELLPEEFSDLFQACKQHPATPGRWNTYHVIGEALRSPVGAVQLADLAFLERLNQQLANEPSSGPGLQMHVSVPDSGGVFIPASGVPAGKNRGPASNDGHFRWKMVAGFACVAAVCAITWRVNDSMLPAGGPQLAQLGTLAGDVAPPQVVVASPQGLMVRDARLEEMLAAHKQLGTTSALPVPSGFLRNATFETQQSLGR